MSSRHRATERARRERIEHERAEAERERRVRRRWQLVAIVAAVLLIGALVAVVLALATGRDEAGTDDAPTASGVPTPTDAAEAEPEFEVSDGWAASSTPPPSSLAEAQAWTATLATNHGDIVVELDGEAAPQAVASFLALAEDGYFDRTECHRLTTSGIYVLQCGDPLGTGAGGPAYTFGPIENAPADGIYPAGTLAMARQSALAVGADAAANSMGSQFFVVYEDSAIPADDAGGYTVFGHVVSGLGIVDSVAHAGTITGDADGRPALSVIVNEVSVS